MPADAAPAHGDLRRLIVSSGRHLRAANRSPRTIEKYLLAARQFAAFCAAHDGPTVAAAVRRRDVETYSADLLERCKPGTAVTRYQDLRVLFGWMVDEEEIDVSPMARMKPPILPEVPVPVLSATEQRALLARPATVSDWWSLPSMGQLAHARRGPLLGAVDRCAVGVDAGHAIPRLPATLAATETITNGYTSGYGCCRADAVGGREEPAL